MTDIVVTGSAGFIGKYVKQELEMAGHTVLGLDKSEGNEIKDLFSTNYKPKFICHLAAVGDIYQVNRDPVEAYHANVVQVAQIMEFAKEIGARVIHTSTWECYSKKSSHYIASKQAGEVVLRAYEEVPFIIFRLGTTFGENMRKSTVIQCFIDKARSGQNIEIFGHKQFRQFIHVKDVALAFRLAVENIRKWQHQAYNIIGKEKIFIASLARYIAKKFGVKVLQGPPREEPELIDLDWSNEFGFEPSREFWNEIDVLCQKSQK